MDFWKMKIVLAILIGIALSISAQTNFFPVLVCKNAAYTNATITHTNPPYVIVDYTNGAARVAITNLPQSIQESIGYKPENSPASAAPRQYLQRYTNTAPEPHPWIPIGN